MRDEGDMSMLCWSAVPPERRDSATLMLLIISFLLTIGAAGLATTMEA